MSDGPGDLPLAMRLMAARTSARDGASLRGLAHSDGAACCMVMLEPLFKGPHRLPAVNWIVTIFHSRVSQSFRPTILRRSNSINGVRVSALSANQGLSRSGFPRRRASSAALTAEVVSSKEGD